MVLKRAGCILSRNGESSRGGLRAGGLDSSLSDVGDFEALGVELAPALMWQGDILDNLPLHDASIDSR